MILMTDISDQINELKLQLAEARDIIRAIRSSEVDVITVVTKAGEQLYSLEGAEQPYREMVETMGEGAVNSSPDGTVLYCNRRFAEMIQDELNRIIGSNLSRYFIRPDMFKMKDGSARAALLTARGRMPVNITTHVLPNGDHIIIFVDLTDIMAIQDSVIKTNHELEQANHVMERRLAENTSLQQELHVKFRDLQELVTKLTVHLS
jgi:PAS domain-containing protein